MRRGFTLLELILVLGLLVIMAGMLVPNFRTPLQQSYLPESGERFRSLIGLTRAHAMLDGLRYRIRFLGENESSDVELSEYERREPLIEIEADPIDNPGEYIAVMASWATPNTFLGEVWCYQVQFGEPTFETVMAQLEEQELEDEEERKQEMGLEQEDDWVLVFEPDGTSEWMTFRLIDVDPEAFNDRDMEAYQQLDVIVDGRLGLVFLQRPLRDEEIEVLLDKGHSPILRRDFMRQQSLTEDDVLEIDMRQSDKR